MNKEYIAAYWALTLPFIVIFIIMMVAYEGGVPFSLYNKIRCRFGKHRYKAKFGSRQYYYCRTCKKPRDFPVLRLIVGQKKTKYTNYKG